MIVGKYIRASCFILLFGTLLFGVIYPLAIWTFAHLLCPSKAEGSPICTTTGLIGFKRIGQHFSSPYYFSSRPEVGRSLVSGGSNLSWSSPALVKKVLSRVTFLHQENAHATIIPHDLLMESASGFDPHISLKAALFQAPRIAAARHITEEALYPLILQHTEFHVFGLFPEHVNVLLLNLALDKTFPLSNENLR